MNYVRKLGFEEAPDYGFLRDLFLKVLKNIGESDDRAFDWCSLNNGKGWEYGSVSLRLWLIALLCDSNLHSVPRKRKQTWLRCRPPSSVNIATASIDTALHDPWMGQPRRKRARTDRLSSSRRLWRKSRTEIANAYAARTLTKRAS